MATTDADKFLRVLRGLIRPLVRTLIARGVTAPAFYRLLKSVYVEVAREEFPIDDTPPTDSRITLLTGVHRRDVRAILDAADGEWQGARAKSAAFATVLARWQALPEWQGRPLTRAEFDQVVEGVSRDIRPRTILDELLRQNLVTEDAGGTLSISEHAIVGPASEDHKLVFFAANIGDHLAAAAENLLTDTPPFLERAVFYNRLTPSAVDQIEDEARRLSQSVLEDLNAQSMALQQDGKDDPENMERYRFGVYFYRDAPTSDGSDTSARGEDE
ncbi:MAG: DUF6502 family protein [Pseudomonadota bacterium]